MLHVRVDRVTGQAERGRDRETERGRDRETERQRERARERERALPHRMIPIYFCMWVRVSAPLYRHYHVSGESIQID